MHAAAPRLLRLRPAVVVRAVTARRSIVNAAAPACGRPGGPASIGMGRAQRSWGRAERPPTTRAQSSAAGGGGGGGIVGGGGGGGGGGDSSSGNNNSNPLAFLAAAWAAYASLLASHPLATKAATSAALSVAGDIAAQTAGEGKAFADVDAARTARFGALGAILVGPALHFWYGALARALPSQTTGAALARLAADQLAFAPLFLSTFIASLGLLEGAPVSECVSRVKTGLRPTLLANWALWVPANFLNFRLVPPPLQVGFANVVALGWNTYLSLKSHAGRD